LRQRYREGQEDQLGTLGLVVNVIVLWNTIYMDAVLQQLRREGYGGVSPNPRNFRWRLPRGSISPEVLEPIWSEFGIAGGVLDVAVPQVMLDRPRVLPVVG